MLTYTSEPLPCPGGGLPRLIDFYRQLRAERERHATAHALRAQWRAVCLVAGVGRRVANPSGGCDVWPDVVHVQLGAGRAATLIVRLLSGQMPEDLAAAGRRLAYGMGTAGVRMHPLRGDFVRVELLDSDPLAGVVAPVAPVRSALEPLTLGVDENGDPVLLDLAGAAHLIVQGASGSGKSLGLGSLLGQLADAVDVRVTGADPTGLLLGPWAGRWADIPAPVLSTADPLAYVLCVERLAAEMDERIAALPAGRDSVDLGPDCPVIVAVLEEYPGALRVLDSADKKLGAQYRALVGRLLAEGRKAGIRVVLITQRADAAIIGGYERGQASHRLSFRVDSVDAVRMLHPDAGLQLAAEHATAPAGVALLTAPGLPLCRLRSPHLPYAEYCRAIVGERGASAGGRTGRAALPGLAADQRLVRVPRVQGGRRPSPKATRSALDAWGDGPLGRPPADPSHAGSRRGPAA